MEMKKNAAKNNSRMMKNISKSLFDSNQIQ